MAVMTFLATCRTVVERLIPSLIPSSVVPMFGRQNNRWMAVNQVAKGSGEPAATVPVLSPVCLLHSPQSQDRRALM